MDDDRFTIEDEDDDDRFTIDEDDDDDRFIIEDEDEISEKMGEMSIQEEEYIVLCIDIGITHLGMSVIVADKEYNFKKVAGIDMIDITDFKHIDGVTFGNCHLHHSKNFTDWLEHIFIYYSNAFNYADKILIERQPPQGLVAVEQLIFSRYRHKSELIHPSSMHKFFGIGHLLYEERKQEVEKICLKYLELPHVICEFFGFERRHDIADSVCFGLFWLHQQHANLLKEENRKRIQSIKMTFRDSNLTLSEWFAQFRYTPLH
jgi:hypothetical protein